MRSDTKFGFFRMSGLLLWTTLSLFACGSSTPDGGGGNGGTGAGGEGGSGGSGGIDEPEVPWDGWEATTAWQFRGSGEINHLLAADFSGTGAVDLAVGGRRPALLAGDGAGLQWVQDWAPHDNRNRGGEVESPYGLAAVPAEHGGFDLLATSSMGDAHLFDGRDGTVLWRVELDTVYPFVRFAMIGNPASPLFFPEFGASAYDAKTGEVAWTIAPPIMPVFARPMRLAGEQHPGLLLVEEAVVEVTRRGSRIIAPAKISSYTAAGELRFAAEQGPDEQVVRVSPARLTPGEGDGVVFTLDYGIVRAIDPQGEFSWETTLNPFENPWRVIHIHLLTHDVTGDGRDEILVVMQDSDRPKWAAHSCLILLDSDGNTLWRHDVEDIVNDIIFEEIDGETLLFVATGNQYFPLYDGQVLALDPSPTLEDAPRVVSSVAVPSPVLALTVFERAGGTRIAYAGLDGVVRALDWQRQLPTWNRPLGSWLRALEVVPLDEERDAVVVGGDHGNVALLDDAGRTLWANILGDRTAGAVRSLASGTLGPKEERRIVVGGLAPTTNSLGWIEVYGLDGKRRLSRAVSGEVLAVAVADLDGDGIDEIVFVEGMYYQTDHCKVVALSHDGSLRFQSPIAPCDEATLAIGSGADDRLLIAVHTNPGLQQVWPFIALLDPVGKILWLTEETQEFSYFLEMTPHGVLTGGRAIADQGFVALRSFEDGEKQWKSTFAPFQRKADPPGNISNAVGFGALLPPTKGKVAKIAVSTAGNAIALLSLGTGAIEWQVVVEDPDIHHSQVLFGGPLALVPQTEDQPAYLVATQSEYGRQSAQAFVISLDGEIRETLPLLGPGRGVAPMRLEEGRVGAVVAAGLGLVGVTLEKRSE